MRKRTACERECTTRVVGREWKRIRFVAEEAPCAAGVDAGCCKASCGSMKVFLRERCGPIHRSVPQGGSRKTPRQTEMPRSDKASPFRIRPRHHSDWVTNLTRATLSRGRIIVAAPAVCQKKTRFCGFSRWPCRADTSCCGWPRVASPARASQKVDPARIRVQPAAHAAMDGLALAHRRRLDPDAAPCANRRQLMANGISWG
jgi:hypothetical protein